MSVLYPVFLWGLLAMAIPVIIHYFNFQRAKKVYFSNVAFLQTVKKESTSRNKLKHLLIMLARMAAILFLVLAFSQPVIVNDGQKGPQAGQVSIYLDNSYSLQNELDNKRLFELAAKYVEQVPSAYPNQTVYQLVTNAFENSSVFFSGKSKLLEKLQATSYSNMGRTLPDVYQRQKDAIAQSGQTLGNHIIWVSDFQKSTIGNLSTFVPDSTHRIFIFPYQGNNANLYIDSVWIESPLIKEKENTLCFARIANAGDSPADQVPVRLYIDGVQVANATTSVREKSSTIVQLNFSVSTAGEKPCRIAIEDFPVTFDNEYFFTLSIAPKVRVACLVSKTESYLQYVFANEPIFEVSYSNAQSIDYNALEQADLIILAHYNTFETNLKDVVGKAIQRGASVAIIPGKSADPSSYTSITKIPMTVPERILSENGLDLPIDIEIPQFKEPFFEGVFEKIPKNMNMPSGSPVLTWSGAGNTVLRYKTNQPFLGIFSLGKAKLYLFSTPFDDDFTTFPKHALFLPSMYRIGLLSKISRGQLAWTIGSQVVALPMDSVTRTDIFKLVNEGLEFIPNQRVVGSQIMLELPKTELVAGNYSIQHTKTSRSKGFIALNYDKTESKLGVYTPEELKELFLPFKNVQILEQIGDADAVQSFRNINQSIPLWRYALLMALAFFLIEVLLVRFWSK